MKARLPFDRHRYSVALLYPFATLQEITPRGLIAGLIAAGVQAFAERRVLWLSICAALVFGFIDQYIGKRMARTRGEFDPVRADMGMYGKWMGIVLVGAVWLFEQIFTEMGMPNANGAFAAATAMWLAWHEVESIHNKYVASGKPPIPIISYFTSRVKQASEVPHD